MKTIFPILILSLVLNCNLFNTKKDDSNQNAILGLLLLSASSGPSCTTSFGTGVADWVKNTFTCTQVTVSGNNYVFKTTSTPNYKSYYYGSTSSYYENAFYQNSSKANYGNPNKISAQNYSFTIPITSTSTTAPATSMGAIGVATNGIVFYNDQAAPGDSLANEYYTFDTSQGHPTNTGSYHYHVDPPKLVSGGNTSFIGIALDGYPVFGRYHSTSDTSSTNNTNLFNWDSTTKTPTTNSTTKCTSNSSTLPTDWAQKANYLTSTTHTDGSNAYHYHVVNTTTEGQTVILSNKYIGAAGSLSQ